MDQKILANTHESIESDPSAEALYKTMDDLQRLTNEAISFGMQMQPSFFEGSSVQLSPGSSSIEHLASQSQLFYWPDEQNETQRAAPGCSQNDQEEPETGGGEAGISNEFSQRQEKHSLFTILIITIKHSINCVVTIGDFLAVHRIACF